jgi:integrase
MPRDFKFTIRKDASRQTSPWWIDIPPRYSETGRRQKRFFETQELAKGELQALKARVANNGIASKLLGPALEEQAAAALQKLNAAGMADAQLVTIVAEFIERKEERNRSVKFEECWAAYLKKIRAEGKSEKHLANIKRTSERFADLKNVLMTDLTHHALAKRMEGLAPSYHNLVLRELRAVLNFAMSGGRDWISANPANKIEFFRRKLGEPEIYSPSEIKAILRTCRDKDSDLLPAFVLMAFCGVRPDIDGGEITKVEWGHVFLEDDAPRLELPGSVTKSGRRRSVKLRVAPLEWLRWWISINGEQNGRIAEPAGEPLRKRIRAIYREAKVDDKKPIKRIQDGLRKSFASYLARAETKDVAIKELGHSGGELLDRHYRSDVTAADAASFWAIMPEASPEKSTGS